MDMASYPDNAVWEATFDDLKYYAVAQLWSAPNILIVSFTASAPLVSGQIRLRRRDLGLRTAPVAAVAKPFQTAQVFP